MAECRIYSFGNTGEETMDTEQELPSGKNGSGEVNPKCAKRFVAFDAGKMGIQDAYICIFGAAAAALDALQPLSRSEGCPDEIKNACHILRQAIAKTEEFVDIQ